MFRLFNLFVPAVLLMLGTLLLSGCGGEKAPAPEKDAVGNTAVSGFRGTQWGMTLEEVKKGEKLKIVKEDSSALICSGEIFGKPGEVFYKFDESGTLTSATVRYTVSPTDIEGAVALYNFIKGKMVSELGAPSIDTVLLLDETITGDLKSPGAGLETGNKIYSTDWNEIAGSQIGIILSKPEDSDLSLGVVYQRK